MLLGCALVAAGCGRESPTQPSTYALTGHVQLIGHVTGTNGQHLETRVVSDADGVPVELLYGNTVVARAHTTDGAFRFTGVAPGGYHVRALIFGSLDTLSAGVTVPNRDVDVGPPIVLESVGDIYPAPNPIEPATVVTFRTTNLSSAALRVLALDGTLIRQLYASQMLDPGLYLAEWNGSDAQGVPLPQGYYWLTFEAGTDQRAQLVFR
jgi:hypothetical protein